MVIIANTALRIWAGYLNQPLSKNDRKAIKEKAALMGKQIVKVTIKKNDTKKVVTGS